MRQNCIGVQNHLDKLSLQIKRSNVKNALENNKTILLVIIGEYHTLYYFVISREYGPRGVFKNVVISSSNGCFLSDNSINNNLRVKFYILKIRILCQFHKYPYFDFFFSLKIFIHLMNKNKIFKNVLFY